MADWCESCQSFTGDLPALYAEISRYQRVLAIQLTAIRADLEYDLEQDAKAHGETRFYYDPGNCDGIGGAESRATFRFRCLGH